MDHKIQDRTCSIHKGQKCIVVNIDPHCPKDQRHCCAICIADQSQLRIIKDYEQAKGYLQENLKKFKTQKEAQNRINLDTLNELSKHLNSLQKYYNQILSDIQQSVDDQIKYLMEESRSLDDKLKLIDIDNFFSNGQQSIKEFDNEKFRKDISAKFDFLLKSDILKECLNQIQKIDSQNIKLEPPKLNDDQVLETQVLQYIFQKDLKFSFPCPFHSQPIRFIFLNEDLPSERRLVCDTCLANNKTGNVAVSIQNAKQQWNSIKDNAIKQKKSMRDKFQGKLITIQEEIKKHQKKQTALLNDSIYELQQKQKCLENLTNQIELFNKEWIQLTIEEAKSILNILISPGSQKNEYEYEQIDDELNTVLENSLKKVKTDQEEFFDSFAQMISMARGRLSVISHSINPNIQQDTFKEEKRVSQLRTSIPRNLKIDFQVVQQSKKVQNDVCNAMAINKQLTFLVAGCGKQIQIFEFIDGKLKQTQLLNDHTGDITALYFMKNTNQFVSGSTDNTIRFWGLNSFGQFGCENIIKNAHSKQVNQVLATRGDELLISCGSIIKFWKKIKNEWDLYQKLSVDGVYSITLNNNQNTLVSTGCHGLLNLSGQICVIKPDHQGLWQVVQTIKTSDSGYKVCFISNNIFVFSKVKGGKLHLYEYTEQSKQFVKTIYIKIDAEDDVPLSMPLDFNQETQLIVNQHGKSINLIKVKSPQEFEVSQVIKFDTNKISGALSDNGQYLITWDISSHEFIVRSTFEQGH